MDVSFSANTWKHFEIQNIDLKLEEDFYASTPYNLNDFKQTSKPPSPIFQTIDSNLLHFKNTLKKQLLKRSNISLAIFVAYLYQFFHQLKTQIQKKSNHPSAKILSQPQFKTQKQTNDHENQNQTDRKMFSTQKTQKNIKSQEFEVLKSLKLKIYQIDLCALKNIPQKFIKYYNNNLLKKIIFQYLSKALYNISLVQILMESNQVLCFALSLVSQSILVKKHKITNYLENQNFQEQAFAFLQHFDSVDDPCLQKGEKSEGLLPSSLSTHSKYHANKAKGSSNNIKTQFFMNFTLTEKEMKAQYSSLREEGLQASKIYMLSLLDGKKAFSKKPMSQVKQINSPNKQSTNKLRIEADGRQGAKKLVPSSKSIQLKSNKKVNTDEGEKGWMKYLGCLKYFLSDSPKS